MENPSFKDLQTAIEEIDGYTQSGFGQIGAVARLALLSREQKGAHDTGEDIASALEVIAWIAADIGNLINCTAEKVGCNYVDKRLQRRAEARLHQNDRKE